MPILLDNSDDLEYPAQLAWIETPQKRESEFFDSLVWVPHCFWSFWREGWQGGLSSPEVEAQKLLFSGGSFTLKLCIWLLQSVVIAPKPCSTGLIWTLWCMVGQSTEVFSSLQNKKASRYAFFKSVEREFSIPFVFHSVCTRLVQSVQSSF